MYCYVPRFAFSLTERVNTMIYCDRRGCFANGPSNANSKQDLEAIRRWSCLCAEQKLVLTLVLNGSWLDCIFGCPYIASSTTTSFCSYFFAIIIALCSQFRCLVSLFHLPRTEGASFCFVSSSFCYLPQLSFSEFSTHSAL